MMYIFFVGLSPAVKKFGFLPILNYLQYKYFGYQMRKSS